MTDVILVRHARTAWSGRRYCGRGDPPLDAVGLATADRLAAELASSLPPGARIVSSPSRRALQTAHRIATRCRPARVAVDARWAEVDFGIAEGLTFEELERRAPDIAAAVVAGQVEIDWPGGETSAAFVARVEGAWRDLARRSEPIVVVSHGGPLRLAIALATGRSRASVAVPEPGELLRVDSALAGQRTSLPATA